MIGGYSPNPSKLSAFEFLLTATEATSAVAQRGVHEMIVVDAGSEFTLNPKHLISST